MIALEESRSMGNKWGSSSKLANLIRAVILIIIFDHPYPDGTIAGAADFPLLFRCSVSASAYTPRAPAARLRATTGICSTNLEYPRNVADASHIFLKQNGPATINHKYEGK
jgi:hypothetical protein